MHAHEKGLCLLGIIALLALFLMLLYFKNLTGAAVLQCQTGYVSAGDYCVEKACQNKQVKCMVQGNLIKRPDCHCTAYVGKFVCGIKGGERTAVKLSTCTRRGQLNSVCGVYDSNRRRCVAK